MGRLRTIFTATGQRIRKLPVKLANLEVWRGGDLLLQLEEN
jgi:hypothetical protein